MKALILVPAHNEARNLAAVVRQLRAAQPAATVLVVDDASTDETPDLLAGLGVRWMRLCEQVGVGSAIRAGLRYASWSGFDIVVRVDGDGQHPAHEVERVLEPIRSGRADAVIGSRYAAESAYRTPVLRRTAQRGLAAWVTTVTGQRITDATSGFWAFGPRAVRMLACHHPTGYPEPELIVLLARNGLRVAEVPIEMRGRTAGRTSLTAGRVGLAGVRTILALLLTPLRRTVASAGAE